MRSKPEYLTCTKQLVLLAALLFSPSAFPQTQPVSATIDASKTGTPISKYVYGQFLEHGGNIVNEGVWAEMLADRKFNGEWSPLYGLSTMRGSKSLALALARFTLELFL